MGRILILVWLSQIAVEKDYRKRQTIIKQFKIGGEVMNTYWIKIVLILTALIVAFAVFTPHKAHSFTVGVVPAGDYHSLASICVWHIMVMM